jgi:hypothetical protein
MTNEAFHEELSQLREIYGSVATALSVTEQQVIRIAEVPLPRGCKPAASPVLLVLQPTRPLIYVKPGLTTPRGLIPRSTSVVSVEGEAWLQFSFNNPFDEKVHTLLQFVEASLRRFARDE